ncbi:MAG: hypothetical protein ABT940_05735 [Alphaproteobacteria bacterium]
MARPRKDTPLDRFTATELEIGGGLPLRSVEILLKNGVAPPAETDPERGSVRYWGTRGVQRIALVGAIFQGGAELLLASRLSAAIAEEIELFYVSGLHSNLWYSCRKSGKASDYVKWTQAKVDHPSEDYWLHRFMRIETSDYHPGVAMPGDTIIEIVDRQYVFINTNNGIRVHSPVSSEGIEAQPSYRVTGWEKGSSAEVHSVADEVDSFGFHANPAAKEQYRRIEAEFMEARRNAVGLLKINMSLAIRKAFDAIFDHRSGVGK